MMEPEKISDGYYRGKTDEGILFTFHTNSKEDEYIGKGLGFYVFERKSPKSDDWTLGYNNYNMYTTVWYEGDRTVPRIRRKEIAAIKFFDIVDDNFILGVSGNEGGAHKQTFSKEGKRLGPMEKIPYETRDARRRRLQNEEEEKRIKKLATSSQTVQETKPVNNFASTATQSLNTSNDRVFMAPKSKAAAYFWCIFGLGFTNPSCISRARRNV